MEKFIRPEVQIDWCSMVGGGMRLEMSTTIDNHGHQLLTILADENDETLWILVCVGDIAVQVPAALVRKMLDDSMGQVHSEAWYGRNMPPGRDA